MQEHVDRVEADGIFSVDPPLHGVGEKQNRPVNAAGAPRAAEIRRREDLGDLPRRADARVVADDRLVVVREAAADAVGVRDDGRQNEHRRTGQAPSL